MVFFIIMYTCFLNLIIAYVTHITSCLNNVHFFFLPLELSLIRGDGLRLQLWVPPVDCRLWLLLMLTAWLWFFYLLLLDDLSTIFFIELFKLFELLLALPVTMIELASIIELFYWFEPIDTPLIMDPLTSLLCLTLLLPRFADSLLPLMPRIAEPVLPMT